MRSIPSSILPMKTQSFAPSNESTNESNQKQIYLNIKGFLDKRNESFFQHSFVQHESRSQPIKLALKLQLTDDKAYIEPLHEQQDHLRSYEKSITSLDDMVDPNVVFNKTKSIKTSYVGNVDNLKLTELVFPKPLRVNKSICDPSKSISGKNRAIQTTVRYFQNVSYNDKECTASIKENNNAEELASVKPSRCLSLMNFKILCSTANVADNNVKLLIPAYNLLKDIFKNEITQELFDSLDIVSIAVVQIIIEKKFEIKLNPAKVNFKSIQAILENERSKKRPEECKKMVFGYAIKNLKRRLKESINCKYKKNGFEDFFYRHYFERVSNQEGIQLEDFYYPIVSEKKKIGNSRTINKTYIKIIKKSDYFINDFQEYIEKYFIADYSKEIDNKLLDLLTKFESIFNLAENKDWKQSMQSQLSLSKSKLPWTLIEVNSAISKVKSILN